MKCPESKFRVTPVEAYSDPNFFLQLIDGKPRLKRNHHYYAKVQGQLGRIQDLTKGGSDKRPPKAAAPRGIRGHAPPENV